jgi:large subunit ribosomal protein L4
MELKIYKSDGTQTDKAAQLNPEIFGIEPNDHAIYLDVKSYLANQRQGTAKTKERSELSGSTRKLYRQKGTGSARRGDIKSPLLRGGARVFGPKLRDYGIKVNKKVKLLARKSALTYKANSQDITILDAVQMEHAKTQEFVQILKNFDFLNKKILLVLDQSNKSVFLSTRNLQNVKVLNATELNTYQVLWANKILITEESLKQIEENILNQ